MNTQDTINRIHETEFDIMLIIDQICRAHNLTYFAIGGSVLGAVRHQGFIPWDDDMDIALLRDDYEKLNQKRKRKPRQQIRRISRKAPQHNKRIHYCRAHE